MAEMAHSQTLKTHMITEKQTANDTNTAVKNPLGLKKIHHIEFYFGNAKQGE